MPDSFLKFYIISFHNILKHENSDFSCLNILVLHEENLLLCILILLVEFFMGTNPRERKMNFFLLNNLHNHL